MYSGKLNLVQNPEMVIIRHDTICITCGSAVNELIVIGIFCNQFPVEVHGNNLHIPQLQKKVSKVLAYFCGCFLRYNFYILLKYSFSQQQ